MLRSARTPRVLGYLAGQNVLAAFLVGGGAFAVVLPQPVLDQLLLLRRHDR